MPAARVVATAAAGLALAALYLPSAQAAVISVSSNSALSTVPVVASLGGGLGTLSFTAATVGAGPGAAVATGGTAQVTTVLGQVADYGIGTVFDGTASFAAFTTPSPIEFSAADDFIGFNYTAADGVHLGYAEVFGSTLVGYAYETVPGASIVGNPIVASVAVPEPASIALLAVGVTAIGGLGGRRRATKQAA